MNFIALDTETGGIGPSVSLLSAHFIVFNKDGYIIEDLGLTVLPQEVDQLGNPIYRVSGQALNINKINLIEHSQTASSISVASALLYEFLVRNTIDERGYINRLIPVGQSIAGDIDHIKKLFPFWSTYTSHIVQDTMFLGKTLQILGLIDPTARVSLANLTKLFEVPLDNAHEAEADTRATMQVFLKMLKLLESGVPL